MSQWVIIHIHKSGTCQDLLPVRNKICDSLDHTWAQARLPTPCHQENARWFAFWFSGLAVSYFNFLQKLYILVWQTHWEVFGFGSEQLSSPEAKKGDFLPLWEVQTSVNRNIPHIRRVGLCYSPTHFHRLPKSPSKVTARWAIVWRTIFRKHFSFFFSLSLSLYIAIAIRIS